MKNTETLNLLIGSRNWKDIPVKQWNRDWGVGLVRKVMMQQAKKHNDKLSYAILANIEDRSIYYYYKKRCSQERQRYIYVVFINELSDCDLFGALLRLTRELGSKKW